MYTQLDAANSGLGDRRITASTIPSDDADDHRYDGQLERQPKAVQDPRSRTAIRRRFPSRGVDWSPTELTSDADDEAATMAATIQRPGWRTGTALIGSERSAGVAVVSAVVIDRTGPIQLVAPLIVGLRDRAGLDAPLRQDRLVLAVRHELLERGEHRLGQAAVLRDRDAVGRSAVRLADRA